MGATPGFAGWRDDGRFKKLETASSVRPPPPPKELITTLHPYPVPFSIFVDLSFLNCNTSTTTVYSPLRLKISP